MIAVGTLEDVLFSARGRAVAGPCSRSPKLSAIAWLITVTNMPSNWQARSFETERASRTSGQDRNRAAFHRVMLQRTDEFFSIGPETTLENSEYPSAMDDTIRRYCRGIKSLPSGPRFQAMGSGRD